MRISMRTTRVADALAPCLGATFVRESGVAEHLAEQLRRFDPNVQPLTVLEGQLRDTLFNDLYAALGPRMTLIPDHGRPTRILVADLDDLADRVMGVLFERLPGDETTLTLLRDYAMQMTSLAAMRMLLVRFPREISPSEKQLLHRVIRDNYPKERYADWLPEDSG